MLFWFVFIQVFSILDTFLYFYFSAEFNMYHKGWYNRDSVLLPLFIFPHLCKSSPAATILFFQVLSYLG